MGNCIYNKNQPQILQTQNTPTSNITTSVACITTVSTNDADDNILDIDIKFKKDIKNILFYTGNHENLKYFNEYIINSQNTLTFALSTDGADEIYTVPHNIHYYLYTVFYYCNTIDEYIKKISCQHKFCNIPNPMLNLLYSIINKNFYNKLPIYVYDKGVLNLHKTVKEFIIEYGKIKRNDCNANDLQIFAINTLKTFVQYILQYSDEPQDGHYLFKTNITLTNFNNYEVSYELNFNEWIQKKNINFKNIHDSISDYIVLGLIHYDLIVYRYKNAFKGVTCDDNLFNYAAYNRWIQEKSSPYTNETAVYIELEKIHTEINAIICNLH